MSKFKVGDRVKVYGNFSPTVYLRGAVGTVVDTVFHDDDETSELTVSVPDWGREVVHPRQLKKLVPAKSKRTYWINVYPDGSGCCYRNEADALYRKRLEGPKLETIQVIEVKRKK